MIRPLLATAAALALAACASATSNPDSRRSGFAEMGVALQAMQTDDALNPASLWVADGEALWQRRPPSGRSCADCHASGAHRDAAARYPGVSEGEVMTLATRIDACRVRHQGAASEGADGSDVIALTAWLARQARGRPIEPPADSRLAALRERGSRLWRERIGQLNLSCAQCHDQRAGLSLGGAVIPQAHPTGYPSYRLEWQTLGSLERRLRGCLVGVRAEPFPPGASEWLALEAFLMQRAAGMAHEGTAVRP